MSSQALLPKTASRLPSPAPPPNSNDAAARLVQAIRQFEAGLSDTEKKSFRNVRAQAKKSPPETADVIRVTAELSRIATGTKGAGDGSSNSCLGTHFTSFLSAAQVFAGVGDLLIGGSQSLIACGVWAVVRTALLAALAVHFFRDKLTTLFMAIGRTAPRHRQLGALYPHSKPLQNHLAEYFIVAVNLCREIQTFAAKSGVKRLASSFLGDATLSAFQADLDVWAQAIRDELNLCIGQRIEDLAEEQGKLTKALTRFVSTPLELVSGSLEREHRHKARRRVLKQLPEFDYETQWKQIRKLGSSTRYLESSKYRLWREDRSGPGLQARHHPELSSTFVFLGGLGSGKSVLFANMVEALAEDHVKVAYFFCRADVLESIESKVIIGCLVRQLLESTWLDFGKSNDTDHKSSSKPSLAFVMSNMKATADWISRLLPPDFTALFVVDGLDECSETNRVQVLEALSELQKAFKLAVCLSFRPLPDGSCPNLALHGLKYITSDCVPDNCEEIEAFVLETLEFRLGTKQLVLGSLELIPEICDALVEGAHGMWLWVALVMDSLCMELTDQGIRDALKSLPPDLPAVYGRILEKEAEGATGRYQQKIVDIQQRILDLLWVACRPLTLDELGEALSVKPGETTWNPDCLINDVNAALAWCGSVVRVDEEELSVRFIHPSVGQYLHSRQPSQRAVYALASGDALVAAKMYMAGVILTYLNYDISERRLATQTATPVLINAGNMPVAVSSVMGPSNLVQVFKLLRATSRRNRPSPSGPARHAAAASSSPPTSSVDITKVLAETLAEARLAPSRRSHHFLNYAKTYWLDHIDASVDTETDHGNIHTALRPLLRAVCRCGVVDLRTRTSRTIDGLQGMSPLMLAAWRGLDSLAEVVLVDGGLAHSRSLDERMLVPPDRQPPIPSVANMFARAPTEHAQLNVLSVAALRGHAGVVRSLMRAGAGRYILGVSYMAEPFYSHPNSPPWLAIASGHGACLEVLRDEGYELEAASTQFNHTNLLMQSAILGSVDAITLLIAAGVKRTARARLNERAPLHLAARAGRARAVRCLLTAEGDGVGWKDRYNLVDEKGWNAATYAANHGESEVLEVLLECLGSHKWLMMMHHVPSAGSSALERCRERDYMRGFMEGKLRELGQPPYYD